MKAKGLKTKACGCQLVRLEDGNEALVYCQAHIVRLPDGSFELARMPDASTLLAALKAEVQKRWRF